VNVLDPGDIGKDSTRNPVRAPPGTHRTDHMPTTTTGHTDTQGSVTVVGRTARHEESDA
jgi:hypothetical protein